MTKPLPAYPFVLLLAIAMFFAGCRKENLGDCFMSTGPDVTSVRILPAFSKVSVYMKIDVLFRQGPEYKVEILAGRNLLKNIKTEVIDGELVIDNLNTCNFVRGYKRDISVVVTSPGVDYVANMGVGTLTIDPTYAHDTLVLRAESSGNIHVFGRFNQVRTSSHGNGDLYLNARCNSLYVFSFGTNYTFAESVQVSDYAFIHTFSIGDCRINVRQLAKLDVNIQGDGNVYYWGNPGELNDISAPEARGRIIKQE